MFSMPRDRIERELRDAQNAGLVPRSRVTLQKDGYIITVSFPAKYPYEAPTVFVNGFDVVPVGEWSPASNLVGLWTDFMAQIGNTDDERLLIASTSLSGFAFLPCDKN